jgi:hypothetical protein
VQGCGGRDGGAEALAEQEGAWEWVVQCRAQVGEQGDGVGDEAGFGRGVRGVEEGAGAEAARAAGYEVRVGDCGDGAVGLEALGFGDVAAILEGLGGWW